MKVTILTEQELRQCVGLDEDALEAVADGFRRLAQGKATMPPILRVDIPENNGEVDIKTAYLEGLDGFAVKMSSGFFNNHELGLPSLSGMMILLSTRTGFPQALLLDNGYLTDVRTGLAGALAAQHLAPENPTTVGVIGAGSQARYQARALQLVRAFERVLVYSVPAETAQAYAAEMAETLGLPVSAVDSAEEVVRESDIVVTTTPSKAPIVNSEWVHRGLHITAMGADAEGKQELASGVLARADIVVCDRKSQAFRLGELRHAREAGILSQESDVLELGDLLTGARRGRTDADQITVCDLTGTGVQDTAIALLAYRRASELGLGTEIET